MSGGGGDKGLAVVLGGAGFLGRHVVRALAARGWRIRVACRHPDLAGHLQPLGRVGQIHSVRADIRDEAAVRRALEGADAVVNLISVLVPSGRQTYRALHTEGARRVAVAARDAGVRNLIYVSAIGADAKSSSVYARTKGEAESGVLAECPSAVVLRPSIVFGADDNFFNRFAGLARILPVLPVIGGRSRFQPVYVGDVAAAVANVLEGRAAPGQIYELGGPEVLTFRQLMQLVLAYSGRWRPLLPLPVWLAKLQAVLTKPLPSGWRPLTVDQVRLLQRDNVVSDAAERDGRTLAGLGIAHPVAIESVVPSYLERFRPRGQFGRSRGRD
ncbi:MAG: complex I NDUFA9 subunit family protein [Hyphomicrobiaceae bacterium]